MDVERTNSRRLTWRGAWAGAFVLLLTLGAPGSTLRGQAAWPFHLEWNYDGPSVLHFRACINGECAPLGAAPSGGTLWRAPLPVLPIGEYRIVVEACGYESCKAGTPDLQIRVVPPSGRRPPIDVISGPRVGVGSR